MVRTHPPEILLHCGGKALLYERLKSRQEMGCQPHFQPLGYLRRGAGIGNTGRAGAQAERIAKQVVDIMQPASVLRTMGNHNGHRNVGIRLGNSAATATYTAGA